jgi:hypothetical protein
VVGTKADVIAMNYARFVEHGSEYSFDPTFRCPVDGYIDEGAGSDARLPQVHHAYRSFIIVKAIFEVLHNANLQQPDAAGVPYKTGQPVLAAKSLKELAVMERLAGGVYQPTGGGCLC